MSDIVERLRKMGGIGYEAADEIERLREVTDEQVGIAARAYLNYEPRPEEVVWSRVHSAMRAALMAVRQAGTGEER